MANDIVNQVKVGSTTYDIKPYLNSAISGDSTTATSWTAISTAIANTDSYDTVFNKITTMVRNVRYLYNKLGTANFSAVGNTTSDAIVNLNNGKSDTTHNHDTAYAAKSHTHNEYSITGHTHSNYSTTGHTHSQYASSTHNHDTAYATKTHSHSEYSTTGHTHSNYSTTGHTHSDYSTTGHTHSYIATSNIVTSQTNSSSKVPAASLCYAMDQAYQTDLTNVTNGKSSIATAITNKGVTTAADATFATMAANIANIPNKTTRISAIQSGDSWAFNLSSIPKNFVAYNNSMSNISSSANVLKIFSYGNYHYTGTVARSSSNYASWSVSTSSNTSNPIYVRSDGTIAISNMSAKVMIYW